MSCRNNYRREEKKDRCTGSRKSLMNNTKKEKEIPKSKAR